MYNINMLWFGMIMAMLRSCHKCRFIVIVGITFQRDHQIVWVWVHKLPNIEFRKSNFEVRTAEQTGAARISWMRICRPDKRNIFMTLTIVDDPVRVQGFEGSGKLREKNNQRTA